MRRHVRRIAGLMEAASGGAKAGLPRLPGMMTSSAVMKAREQGCKQLTLLPAVPTGGISQETAPAFLALKNVACVGGSWLTPKDAMKNGDWAHITMLAKAASALRG